MDIITDKSFGKMTKAGNLWEGNITTHAWRKKRSIRIAVKAYGNKDITDKQRKCYEFFKANTCRIFRDAEKAVIKYANDVEDYSLNSKNFTSDVKLKSIFISNDGSLILLCDASWDEEHGIGIQVLPTKKVGPQDIFL